MNFHPRRIWLKFIIGALIAIIVSILFNMLFSMSPWYHPRVSAVNSANPVLELWRISPPAPKITDNERVNELRARRQEVMKRISDRAVMVLFSAEPRVYTGDVDYHYRQENNLYYLTNIRQHGAVLVLIPGAKETREILFMPERNPLYETWNGRMMSFDEARSQSGIREVWDIKLLHGFFGFLVPRAEKAFTRRGNETKFDEKMKAQWESDFQRLIAAIKADQGEIYLLSPRSNDHREYRQEHELAKNISSVPAGLKVIQAHPLFSDLRHRKSELELKLLQHAIDITSEAFHRVFASAVPGMYEYEIQAEFEYTFRRRNADFWGYPSIVGAGANATTLHYITSQDRLDDGALLLMDCGAEYDHYSADITRTIPVNGKFNRDQAEIYRIVYEAQQESIKAVYPGNTINTRHDPNISPQSVHGRSVEVIKDGLLRLGLITSKDNNEYRIWFMHGTSHWLGMNVHDVGDNSKPLAPGMVLTVEPGIYVRPDALDVMPKTPESEKFIKAVRPAFEKYKGIGVRIEDDVLVTEKGYKVMSTAIPSKLEDVEATIAKLREELRKSGWPQVAAR